MNVLATIKDKIADRKAKKARRAAMSFNSHSGAGPAKHVRPESPGARVTGASGSGTGSVGGG